MEQGDINNYTDTEKYDRIRRANAQRHLAPSPAVVNFKKQNQKTNKSMLCTYYNQGTHDTKGVTYKQSVQHVLLWVGRFILTQSMNVGIKTEKILQKTRSGYASSETYPDWKQ